MKLAFQKRGVWGFEADEIFQGERAKGKGENKMKIVKLIVAGLFLSASVMGLSATRAPAAIIAFSATLDGAQEVPPVVTTGTGTASMTLDDSSNFFSWNISWSGLSGPATAVLFHVAPPGVNGAVSEIGFLSTSSPSVGSMNISSGLATDLLAGNLYINVHTAAHPGGEIRGQVVRTEVPEPATLTLFGLGLAGLGFSRRKRFA